MGSNPTFGSVDFFWSGAEEKRAQDPGLPKPGCRCTVYVLGPASRPFPKPGGRINYPMQGNASKAAYQWHEHTKYDEQLGKNAWRPTQKPMPARHREWTGKAVLCSS